MLLKNAVIGRDNQGVDEEIRYVYGQQVFERLEKNPAHECQVGDYTEKQQELRLTSTNQKPRPPDRGETGDRHGHGYQRNGQLAGTEGFTGDHFAELHYCEYDAGECCIEDVLPGDAALCAVRSGGWMTKQFFEDL